MLFRSGPTNHIRPDWRREAEAKSVTRTALVTGGAGFIGSHLVDRLLKEGWKVIALDNMKNGHASNLVQHKLNQRFQFREVDIRNAKVLRKLSKGCDTVFHMAAHADIRASLGNHLADLENNIIGTINVLEAMVENDIEDLVFASTSALYGEARVRPTPEDYAPVQTSLYGSSKLACEAYAQAYTQFAPTRFWAFRFANVIGERCRRGVVWDFVHKLRRNPNRLEILGNGKQSKEYLYVKDCIEGMMLAYQKSSDKVKVFNLGVEEQTTVDKVADIVIEEMGLAPVTRTYTGGPRGWIGDNPIVELSMEKMKELGWRLSISAEEAIRRTAQWTINDLSRETGTRKLEPP